MSEASEYDKLVNDRALSLQAAARSYTRTMAELLYKDNHYWSERPCGTCKTISALIGEPFGCYRYAEDRRRQQRTGERQ